MAIKKNDFKSIKDKFSTSAKYKPQRFLDLGPDFLDAVGLPGPAIGHLNMFLGHSDTGKTTALVKAAVDAQKKDILPVFIITEQKWSFEHAKLMGFQCEEVVDKETGELAKAFGTSYANAASLRNELNSVANLSGDVNINTSALQKSLVALNQQFGTSTMMSGELLKDFTRLTEVAGYSADAAAGLSRITVATGTDLSKNTEAILGEAAALNAVNGLALNEKQIVEEVAKASAATTLSLGMQPKELAKAVVESKALGASLQEVEQISQQLLQFESSIGNELEAELLTGKDRKSTRLNSSH